MNIDIHKFVRTHEGIEPSEAYEKTLAIFVWAVIEEADDFDKLEFAMRHLMELPLFQPKNLYYAVDIFIFAAIRANNSKAVELFVGILKRIYKRNVNKGVSCRDEDKIKAYFPNDSLGLLREKGSLAYAAAYGNVDIVKMLFYTKGINNRPHSAIKLAAKKGHLDVVSFLFYKSNSEVSFGFYYEQIRCIAKRHNHSHIIDWINQRCDYSQEEKKQYLIARLTNKFLDYESDDSGHLTDGEEMEKEAVNNKITMAVEGMSIKKLERASVDDIAKFIDYSKD
jgi:hypothetical protein